MTFLPSKLLPDSAEHPDCKRCNQEKIQENRKRVVVGTKRKDQDQKQRKCGKKPFIRCRAEPAGKSDQIQHHCQDHKHHDKGKHTPVIPVICGKCAAPPVEAKQHRNSCHVEKALPPLLRPQNRHCEEEHSRDHAGRHDQHPHQGGPVCSQRRQQHIGKCVISSDSEQLTDR